ncbi:interferon-induced GTP-binding protein Mx-like [Polypterus senegalus]|uniref:interferon-induced GTP-binding protein Mx-like n=1 Tax=Polypterus senegalus TaxID=55291 RepID=UPI001966387D|nr:interferon-induced GTP-binding protein Mx-like [Polypterus senegalus]
MSKSKITKGLDPLKTKQLPLSNKVNGTLYCHYEQKVRPYIDLIDSLRSLGVDQDLPLPSIAVIGDQSSGKSSVLEALSGVSLPRGSGIVTRCPLELKMKKIRAGEPWKGKLKYRDIEMDLDEPHSVEQEIVKAQNIMAGTGSSISPELISLQIESSEVPDLTLIDLPGIARVAVGNQPKDIGERIKGLIQTFIKKQETINLVVVPSNVDIATTEALKMAKEFDPSGQRTLGILTKPDLIDKGNEENIVDIVRNHVIELKKGYMIVKCRGQQDIKKKLSLEEAIQNERVFFEQHSHFSSLLDDMKATIPLLAEKLTNELVEHISESLPSLQKEIEVKLQETAAELKKHGKPVPEEDEEKLTFLVEKLQSYYDIISSIIKGEEMCQDQESKIFNQVREKFEDWKSHLDLISLNLEVADLDMKDSIKKNRGKELPGFINYSTFEKFMKEHIEKAEAPSFKLLSAISELIRSAFTKTAKAYFENYPNLLRAIKCLIEDILKKESQEAEKMLYSQFNMERIVFSQDIIYSRVLSTLKSKQKFPQDADVSVMKDHLNTYFEIASDRLANQIPLIILYHIVNQFGTELQKQILQLIQGDKNVNELLSENKDVAEKRNRLSKRLERLSEAQEQLNKFSV